MNSISDVIPEVMSKFDLYVKSISGSKDLVSRFFSILRKVANENSDGFPLISEKTFKTPTKRNVTEPLSQQAYDQLTAALKGITDKIYEKIEFIKSVDNSKPYTVNEINNLAKKHQNKADYNKEWYWEPDDKRVIKTLLVNGFPFAQPLEDFLTFSEELAVKLKERPFKLFNRSSIVEIICLTYRHSPTRTERRNNLSLLELCTFNDLLEKYFPTGEEQAALAIFINLQTGWNKETVFAIDPKDYEHLLSGSLDENHVLLTSEKEKSQSTNLPYFTPKTFLAPSDKSDKYSSYNLINLAIRLSSLLTPFCRESCNSSDLHYSELFLVMRTTTQMVVRSTSSSDSPVGRFTSVSSKSTWTAAIKSILKEHLIIDTGGRITTVKELTPRLRPTWIRYVRDVNKSPLSVVSLQQGHGSIETTDVHYDNSNVAQQKRKERLTVELSEITKLLRQKKFKGLVHKLKAEKKLNSSLRLFIMPFNNQLLWACQDSFAPDFPEVTDIVRKGSKCTEISKCLFCSKVRIFEDSLPFIIERGETIQKLLDSFEGSQPMELQDELEVIRYILNEWQDDKALKQAARHQRRFDSLLPVDMGSLKVIFEDK
ncbi:MAG: hypothetical protein ABJD02_20805 [Paraglaciecola sp.]|uniref:hypothetical protein n=2 Tax=Paraglaciecola sp. TaxID=1920173 RepID=UPI0032660100